MRTCARIAAIAAASAAALALSAPTFARVSNSEMAGSSYNTYDNSKLYQRVVYVGDRNRSIGVAEGEVIKFIDRASGNSFVWKFGDLGPGPNPFMVDMSTLAPAGTFSHRVTAYIAPSDDFNGSVRR